MGARGTPPVAQWTDLGLISGELALGEFGAPPVEEDEAAERAAEEEWADDRSIERCAEEDLAADRVPEQYDSGADVADTEEVIAEQNATNEAQHERENELEDDVEELEEDDEPTDHEFLQQYHRQNKDAPPCSTHGHGIVPKGAATIVSPALRAYELKVSNRYGALNSFDPCLSQQLDLPEVAPERCEKDDAEDRPAQCSPISPTMASRTARARRKQGRSKRILRRVNDTAEDDFLDAQANIEPGEKLLTPKRSARRKGGKELGREGSCVPTVRRAAEKEIDSDVPAQAAEKERESELAAPEASADAAAAEDGATDDGETKRGTLTEEKANMLAMMTARMHEGAISRYLRKNDLRKAVIAAPVDAADVETSDMLDIMLGMVVHCEASDASSGWAFGTVIGPKELAERRGGFRVNVMRPVTVEVRSNRFGDELLWARGSWELVGQVQAPTTQARLRQKALMNRLRSVRAACDAKSASR